MPAGITIDSIGSDGVVHLGETFIPRDDSSLGSGEHIPVFLRNSGDTMLRDIEISLSGVSAGFIQLAADDSGQPSHWADAGQPIAANVDTLLPGGSLMFWARATYKPDDAEGKLFGSLVISAISS